MVKLDKTLLIIGAGREQVYAYQLATEMGLRVVGTDMDPKAPAFEHADHNLMASTRDVSKTLELRDGAAQALASPGQ